MITKLFCLMLEVYFFFYEFFGGKKEPLPDPKPEPTPAPEPVKPEPVEPEPIPEPEHPLVEKINAHRERYNIPVLKETPELSQAAFKHAQWMEATRRMSHRGKGGSTPMYRARKEGYTGHVAENIAMGTDNEHRTFNLWMSSSGHKKNMESPKYKSIGVAIVGKYACAVFGTE